jgi:6-pyruvoyltetrahydropterin/6-carboxytetrahydropterin synthase
MPMYQVGTSIEVRALHVMPGAEGPEGQPHAHDYKIEVLVGRADLDQRGMVCDLDILGGALRRVADTVRDADLEAIRPPGTEAVTVEVFAHWAHGALADAVRTAGGEDLMVRVWESQVAFGAYGAPVTMTSR